MGCATYRTLAPASTPVKPPGRTPRFEPRQAPEVLREPLGAVDGAGDHQDGVIPRNRAEDVLVPHGVELDADGGGTADAGADDDGGFVVVDGEDHVAGEGAGGASAEVVGEVAVVAEEALGSKNLEVSADGALGGGEALFGEGAAELGLGAWAPGDEELSEGETAGLGAGHERGA